MVTRAFTSLEGVNGVGYLSGGRTSGPVQMGGIEEALFRYEDGDAMTPQLIESWDFARDGRSVTMTLREGLKWQSPVGYENHDFGELDANELEKWLNLNSIRTYPNSLYEDRYDLASIFISAVSISSHTVKFDLVTPIYYCLPLTQFGCLGTTRGPHKVTTVDEFGADWAKFHHIGTGPYVQGDRCVLMDRCVLNAVEAHWRKVPSVAVYQGVHMPDVNVRIAALRSGTVDMAEVDFTLHSGLVDGESFHFLQTQPGGYIGQSVIFSGNLWEERHIGTGEPLEPWKSTVYNADKAWIGDPWQEIHPELVRYTDTNNPDGMTDMEQARLVRLALSIAIDRSAINDDLLGGLGLPLYSEYMGPEYPGWDPERVTDCYDFAGSLVSCSGATQPVPWELEDGDLETAHELLVAAGYPLLGTIRQGFGAITLHSYPAETGEIGNAVGQAITSAWSKLGIQISQVNDDYFTVIAPRMRDRTQFMPVLKNGDIHSNSWPLDWPMPYTDTSFTRPNWGVGFESPAAANWFFQIFAEPDRAKREQAHLTWVDYSLFWNQYAGVYQFPKGIVTNDRVESWNGYQMQYWNVSKSPEFIVLN